METVAPSRRVPSPTAGIENVNRTLKALYAYKRLPATYKDIAGSVGLHETVVSLGLSTARELGFLRLAGRKGLYDFTSDGTEYCRYLTSNMTQDSRTVLKRTLLNSPQWADVIAFLRANTETPRDPIAIILDIEGKLGKKWSPAMRKTVSDSLVSILEYAELVRRESGKIVSLVALDTTIPQSPAFVERFPIPTVEPSVPRTTVGSLGASEFYEFRDEGVYIKIRKDDRSIALAKDLVDLFSRRHQSDLQTTHVEEAPGKN